MGRTRTYTLIHVSRLSESESFTLDFMLNKYYLMIDPVPWQIGCLGRSSTSGHIATEAWHSIVRSRRSGCALVSRGPIRALDFNLLGVVPLRN
jgi:hypothetical protein